MSLFDREVVILAAGCWLFWTIPGCWAAKPGMPAIVLELPSVMGRTPPNDDGIPIWPETPGIITGGCPNVVGPELRWSGTIGEDVPNGFGPGTGAGCPILLSVGRILLLIGIILSKADISTVLTGVVDLVTCDWPFHDWVKDVFIVPCDVPQHTVDVEPMVEGDIVDPMLAPTDDGRTDVFISAEDKSRTDVFVTTGVPDVVADGASCNGVCVL